MDNQWDTNAMTNEERLEAIWAWNAVVPETIDRCVHDLIAERINLQPDAQAVFALDGTLTYRELDALSERLARHLVPVIRKDTVVPLCFAKSMWTVVAVLSILKAGGAFVLLDVSQPEARLRSIVQQTKSPIICASAENQALGARLIEGTGNVVSMGAETFASSEPTDDVEQRLPKSTSSSICYVVFTSGSTGLPKGAMISHSNICSAFHHQLDDLGFNPQSRTFDFASYAFDVAIHNLLATLVAGGCLCIPSDVDRLQDPGRAMASMGVTIANLTPSFSPLIDPERVPTLRTLIFLGEPLSRYEAQRWWQRTAIINTYGPAECTPISTIDSNMRDPSIASDIGIGSGVGAVSWVVDSDNHNLLCEPGQVGELLLEGPVVGLGYLNDPEKTAEAFIQSPSWLLPKRRSRLYKTGDLVVYSSENRSLRFIGRKDTQIKLHGMRVETGEVEHHVQACFSAALQTVVETVGPKTNPSLAAFLHFIWEGNLPGSLTETNTPGVSIVVPDAKVVEELSQRLPSYMLPTIYFSLADVPRTASGKVDRKQLRELGSLYHNQQTQDGTKRQPSTEMERNLQSLWAHVLELESESLGLDDSFIRIGGDSLAAIRLVSEARQAGIQLRVADVFQRPIFEDQARAAVWAPHSQPIEPFSLCEGVIDVAEIVSLCNTDMSTVEDVYPCTPLQEGLLSLTMQRPLDYVCQLTVPISNLRLDAVKAAWEQTSNATPILRTRFVQTKSGLLQAVLREPIVWHFADDLQECQQYQPNIDFGSPLSRFFLIGDHPEEPKWMVLTLHHSLYDAWSLDLLISRARDFYMRDPSRPPPEQPKPDFNAFVKHVEESSVRDAPDPYWRDALNDTQSVQFPTVRTTQQLQVANEAMEWSFKMPPGPTGGIEATRSTLLRAALAILLSHHTESSDVTFGATVSGRNAPIPGIEAIVGPTIATLPIRVRFGSPEVTVSQFLQELQNQATDMIPFEQTGLVRISRLGDGPRRACDFQTLLVVQPGEAETRGTVFGNWQSKNEQLSTYALTLECFLFPDDVKIKASFSPRAIDPWRLDRMLGQYGHIIAQLADPQHRQSRLTEIDVMPERDQVLLSAWNATPGTSIQACVHELFREQVRVLPKIHQAVCSWDGNLTYQELDSCTDRLANHLVGLGVGNEMLVPICFERCLLPIVAMLGVLKAGAGFVPIDPSLPEARRRQILRGTEAKLILTSTQYSDLFADATCRVVPLSLDLLRELPDGKPSVGPPQDPTSIAYILFTSGSTGQPKGVTLEHGAVSSSCTAHGKVLDFHPSSRVLQFSSYVFDACILEIITTFIYGGCVCIPTEDEKLSDLAGVINTLNINWICITPSVARLLDPASIKTVKTFVLGGEKVNSEDAETWVQAGYHVISGYGPTECCVFASLHDFDGYIDSGLIGQPVGSVAWLVNPDDHNRLVPVGGIGELLVEGPNLARGYLNDEQKTAASFIRDPTWSVRGGPDARSRLSRRFYKTGDLVQYLSSEGTLRYLGRKDTQSKIRGQRLELADVETHVKQCIPGADQVVAETISVGTSTRTDTLVAFVRTRPSARKNGIHESPLHDDTSSLLAVPPEVVQKISQRLPSYMVPTLYVSIPGSIPRMPQSGKTNRGRLREIASAVYTQHVAEIESSEINKRQPSTESEYKLRGIWARVLNVTNEASIGLDDDFFERGGDSITAMKLVAEARKADVTMTVADVFRSPTLATQAALQYKTQRSIRKLAPFSLLGRAVDEQALCEDLTFSYRDDLAGEHIEDVYPCTPLQEGILSLASKHPGGYVMQNLLELPNDICLPEFKMAWEAIVRSTPALRTRIVQHQELGLVQMVLRTEMHWNQDEVDLDVYLKSDKVAPMGLGQPLSRFALIGNTDEPRFFVWTAHHALYDGWSLPLVTDMVNRLYLELCAHVNDRSSNSGQSAMAIDQQPFSAFVSYVENQKGEKADRHWSTALQNNETSPFPLLPSNVREPEADMTMERSYSLFAEQYVGRHPAVTISTLIHAAFAILVSRHTGSPDIVYGTTLSGRNAPIHRITDIVGPTISTIPLRIRLDTELDCTVMAFLQNVARQTTDDIQYEQIGLQYIAKLSKDSQRACQFQTLLVIQSEDDEIPQNQAVGTWRNGQQLGFTTYAVTLECFPTRDSVRFRSRFDSRVIDAWRMERVLCQLVHIMGQLESVSNGSDKLLADIDLLSLQDRDILQRWNGAPPNAAVERCLHEMIRAQALERATKTAIVGWDGQFTYEQLDSISDRLGAYLVNLGVGPETMVPLCFPKSTWTPIAMLSVMKAGGAFVLLDPNHPKERLRMLCEKTGATVGVAAPGTAGRIDSFVRTVVILDQHMADWLPLPALTPTMRSSPANTAYVIFTSGSTGVPKGCKIEHRSFASAAMNQAWIMGMSPDTRAFQFGSYIFAGALLEILLTLLYGGCVCVPSDEERHSRLDQAIVRLRPNWAFFTPSVLSSLSPEMVPSLETICIGGEAIYHSQIAQWTHHIHLRQTYGSAETGAVISSAHLTECASTSDVGQPTAGRYWIVDASDVNRLAPIGSAGEVIIEGPSIGREYFDEPEKTAAAFIKTPVWRKDFGAPETGARFYKTGDLATYTVEGAIRLHGRKDTQVKLRGQRIELGEVEEQARAATKLVAELAVELAVPRDSDLKAAMLVAYIVLRKTAAYSQEAKDQHAREVLSSVRERLQTVLPQHMVPSVFIALPELPKTISKKIDRKSLRAMAASYSRKELVSLGSLDDGLKRQPTTERERRLQAVWSQVLDVEPQNIGLDDDFFQIGGDSISALSLVAEARRTGFPITMADVFRQRTLAGQARTAVADSAKDEIVHFSLLGQDTNLEELRHELATSCGTDASAIEDAYPCTSLQEGLLSLTFKNAGDYVMQSVIQLSSDIQLEQFKLAWQQTVSAVATLRTRVVQHSRLGTLQVVIKTDIDWQKSTEESLEAFLDKDKLQRLDFGYSLSRFTLVGDQAANTTWFVWTAHHALYDGWSLPLVINMVKDAYLQKVLPDQKPFSPFIKYLRESDPDDADAYWKSTLQGFDAPSFPALPSPMHRPTAEKTIERFCDIQSSGRTDTTLSTLIRAALGVVIGQHSKSSDVVFGAVVSGRNAPVNGIEQILGPTIATVPIRVQLPREQLVTEYLSGLEQQAVDMIKFEQTGIQNIAQLNKSACVFQTLLVIQPAEQQKAQDDETFGKWLTDPEQTGFTTYALTLQCSLPVGVEGVQIRATFDSAVIPLWNMSKLLDQFSFALQQLAHAQPEQTISGIDLLTPEDRHALWDLNKTVPQPVEVCIHDLIREQTLRRPDAIALSSWEGEMTYMELDHLSDLLAQRLVSFGAKPGDLVPLCFEKSIWTSVAAVAAMKSGLGSLTMDTTQPAERLRATVQQIDARFSLCSVTHEKLASEVLPGKPALVVGRHSIEMIGPSPAVGLPTVSPSSIVCVLSTSGSTGIPKAIAMTHTNFATGREYHAGMFGYTPGGRVLAFASYSFDISWFDRLHALASGSTLCIPSEAERKDDLEGAIFRLKATTMFLTPSVARLIRPEAVPSVRTLILGGEPQRWSDFRPWPEHMTRISIYGPAECTVVSSASDARILEKRDMTLPADLGLNSWLVDPTTEMLSPIGTVGEIWLEGPLVGAGYIGDKKRSAASFVKDPPWLLQGSGPNHPGRHGRLYKTGDLARYMPDGSMAFAGRKDNQIKLRGQRIEIAEVELHVRRVVGSEVKQVVVEVVTFSSEKASAMLVAFLEIPDAVHNHRGRPSSVATPEVEPEAELMAAQLDIVDKLSKLLPSFMVPRVFFAIRSIPRTVNGKTDRARLRRIGSLFSMQQLADLEASRLDKRQPTSTAESQLQRLWAQVLNVRINSIGIDDNFFQLGADSIAAMKLVGQARKNGITRLTVADVFRLPTLQAQAQLQLQYDTSEDVDHISGHTQPFSILDPSIDRNALCDELRMTFEIAPHVEDVYPCTPLQEGLLSLTMKQSGDYVLQSVLELASPGTFQLEAFQAAWQETVHATDMLHTRIVQHDSLGMLQVVLKDEIISWHRTSEQSLEAYLQEDKSASMDLGQPLTRFAIITDKDGTPRHFVWTLHHALYDGWSLPMVFRKAAESYLDLTGASRVQERSVLDDNPRFNSFVRYVETRKGEDSNRYWQSALAGTQAVPFPTLPASMSQPMADRTIAQSCTLSKSTLESSNVTTSTLVRAALALLISRQTSIPEAVFGAIVSGRNAPIPHIEEIVGPTIATVPLRIQVPAEATVSDYLSGLQQQAAIMIPYEQTGLQNISQLSPDAHGACEFQTLLVMQPSDEPQGGDGDDSVRRSYGVWSTATEQRGFTTFGLTIECLPSADGIVFRASFDSRVLGPWRVERLLTQLKFFTQQLLTAVPGATVAEIVSVPPEDLDMIWDWNSTVPKTIEQCVHDIIRDKAHEHPESVAVCAWDGEVTYRQLDDLSERLAHELITAGVSPGTIVPLCFEKSMWTTIGLLATLKAGAAFVFLDAETQPEARLRSIVEQAHATIICSSTARQELSRRLVKDVVVVGPDTIPASSTPTKLPQVDSSNPLYLIFTSGSTGQPKGALLPHKSFASALHHQQDSMSIGSSTKLYDFASYSFDVAIHDVLATLAAGGCLCVPSDADRKGRLAESMEELGANYANLTSSVARLLDPIEVPTLETLTLGGEPVTLDDAEKWWGRVKLINSCGPAECTPLSVINDFAQTPAAFRGIGFGRGNVTWVVDPQDHDVLLPVGQSGELILEGPLVGDGYLNDPERTAATFIEDPAWLVAGTSSHPGRRGRVYKTGDLVRYEEDGSLQIEGRKDFVVKVRGQRVVLEEVDHYLRRCLPTAQVVADTVTNAQGSSAVLAAFICSKGSSGGRTKGTASEATASIDEDVMQDISSICASLSRELSRHLPSYMVPSIYVPVESMPMTATAKVNRRQLRDLVASLSKEQLDPMRGLGAGGNIRLSPETKLGRQLQALYARLLHAPIDSIGRDDDFFKLGGDSITAMKVVGEARRLGIHLSVADLFQQRTIAGLVEKDQINGERTETLEPVAPKSFTLVDSTTKAAILNSPGMPTADNICDILPLTNFQAQCITYGITHPQAACNYFWLDIGTSNVDPDRLRKSCQLLLDHYPILRSVFIPFQTAYWQAVLRKCEVSFSKVAAKSDLNTSCEAICSGDSQEGLHTGQVPTSFTLVQSARQGYRLILRLSHAQYDGVCLPMMLQSLADFYHGRSVSAGLDFSIYLAHQFKQRATSSMYWKKRLSGLQRSQISSRLSRGVKHEESASKIVTGASVTLPPLRGDNSIAALTGSAWAILLSLVTDQADVVFGHVVAGREAALPGIQDIIGPCVNIIPVRVQISPGRTTASAVTRAIQEQFTSLQQAGLMMGWEDIIRSSTDWSASFELDSVVQHQNIDEHPELQITEDAAQLQWYDNPDAVPQALGIASYPEGTKLRIEIRASSHTINLETADLLVGHLCDIVSMLASCADKPIPTSFLDNMRTALRSYGPVQANGLQANGLRVKGLKTNGYRANGHP